MATSFKPSVHFFVMGLKLLSAIAGTELMIMLLAGWFHVERWFTPMQFNFIDTSILSVTASFLIFYWVIKPLKAASRTIEEYRQLEKERKKAEEALWEREERYRLLFYNTPIGIFNYDMQLHISDCNDAFINILKTNREKLLGLDMTILNDQRVLPALRAAMEGNNGFYEGPYRASKSRPEIFILMRTAPLLDESKEVKGGVGIVEDITERRKAADDFAAHARQTALGADVGIALTQSEDLRGALQFCAESLVKNLGAAFARIWTLNEKENVLELQASAGMYTHLNGPHGRVPVGQFKIGLIAQEKKPHLTNAVMDDPRIGDPEWAKREGMVAFAGYPLIVADKLVGVMAMFSKTPLSDMALTAMASIADEIAVGIERKRSEERVLIQLQQLSALRSIDMAISSSLDIRLTLDIFLEQVINQLHVDAAGVLLFKPHTKQLEFAAQRGFRTQALKHTRIRLGQGNAGLAALKRSIVHVPDIKSDEEFAGAPLLRDEQFVTYYGVPLIAKGEVKGVLEIFHRSPLNPNHGWQDFLEALALQAAIAIDNASLFENLEKSNLELVMAYDSTIEGWSRALDYRDKETEGHSQRVTELAVKICQAMGMTDRDLTYARWGALLHDIGKLGVPDDILFKPGKLDDDEWKLMKRHPVLAHELLQPIRYLGPAVDIPYCHHEKWDGTGYPRGLKGEQIPLAARIFSIVDVWDALGSDRPYRSAWPKEKIFQYLNDQTGKDFDPKVTEAFIKLINAEATNEARSFVGTRA
jgi:PAS domain S-box-containing protein/putative nucleotidyltransferase with HDIG domain